MIRPYGPILWMTPRRYPVYRERKRFFRFVDAQGAKEMITARDAVQTHVLLRREETQICQRSNS